MSCTKKKKKIDPQYQVHEVLIFNSAFQFPKAIYVHKEDKIFPPNFEASELFNSSMNELCPGPKVTR